MCLLSLSVGLMGSELSNTVVSNVGEMWINSFSYSHLTRDSLGGTFDQWQGVESSVDKIDRFHPQPLNIYC